jgi:hypothetical protein
VIRTTLRWLLHSVWLALAVWTPWTERYTSVGFERERLDAGVVHGDYWRVRWPGDGSIAAAWVAASRPARADDRAGFDLGAAFLEPPRALAPAGFWQRQGFWWVVADARKAPVPPIVAGADRAVLLAAPHVLVTGVLAAAAMLWEWRRRRGTRERVHPPAQPRPVPEPRR